MGVLIRHSPVLPPAFNSSFRRWPRTFARYAEHLAPDVDVRELEPGETMRIGAGSLAAG